MQDREPYVAEDDEIDLLALAGVLWRGKWIILAFAALFTTVGWYYAYRIAVPSYSAQTSIAIEVGGTQLVDIESVVTGVSSDWYSLNTEVGKITSRRLGEALVRRLNLTEDPSFNPFLSAEIEEQPEPGFISRLFRSASGEEEAPPPTEEQIFNATVDSAMGAVSVSRDQDSYIFTIEATTGDREKSVAVANAHAEAYIADQIAVKFEAIENAVTWLSGRVSELEGELQQQEDRIKDLRGQATLATPETLLALNQQASDMKERLQALDAAESATSERVSRFEELQESGDRVAMLGAFTDPTLRQLYERQSNGDQVAADLFDERFSLLVQREASDNLRATSQKTALEASFEGLQAQIFTLTQNLIEVQQAEREAEATRILYETFLTRLKEATVQRGLQEADALVLSPAVYASKVAPRETRILALSFILGSMLGVGLVLLQQLLHRGFLTAEDLEKHSGLTVLGQIPRIPIRRRDELVTYLNEKPTSAASEAIRNLRTSVLLSNVDEPPKVIMSTSSLPSEGKTTQAIALAHNFVRMGKKVLLVEGDIRRRTFSMYFQGTPKTGLISALSGQSPLEDVVFKSEELGCDIIMGEKSSVNAADLFSSERFEQFLQYVRSVYDIVIIDSPPVLVVPDARVIGQHVDAILYCVHWDKTTKSQVDAGIRQFATANLKIAGFSLSQIDPAGMRKYGYGGKYGTYGAYSKYGSRYYDT